MQSNDYLMDVFKHFDVEIVRKLSKLHVWKSSFWIFFQWASIIVTIILMTHLNLVWYAKLPLYLLAIAFIGARQHGLAILMHDGAHHRLHRNHIWNEVISDLFLAWPLLITTRTYRENHLAHHNYINTQNDPDFVRKMNNPKEAWEWQFPMSIKNLSLLLLKDVSGWNSSELFSILVGFSKNKNSKRYAFYRIAYYVLAAGLISVFHLWTVVLLYWIIPILTWLKLALRVRSIAEHFAITTKFTDSTTRTTYPSVFDRLFIAACNVWHHADHHLYPSVPFYNIPELHRELLKLESVRKNMHITQSYWGVLKECVNPLNPN